MHYVVVAEADTEFVRTVSAEIGANMTSRAITKVDGIAGTSVSDDGEFVLLGVAVQNAANLDLMMPTDRAVDAIMLLSQVVGQAERNRTGDSKLIYRFPTEHWTIRPEPDGKALTMTYRLKGGGDLHFLIERPHALSFLESLASILGIGPAIPVPPGPKH